MQRRPPIVVASSRARRRLVSGVKALAIANLAGLLATAATFHWIGERWWVTAIGLYLPRAIFAAPLPFVLGGLAWLRERRWLWAQALAVFLLIFPILGLVLPWPRFAGGAPVIRVLSYNVDSAQGGADRIVAEVDRFSPDVVMMQEIAQATALEPLLRARYATVVLQDQFILATRYPLSALTSPQGVAFEGRQHSPRFLRYVLDTPLGPVVFYNVHPVSPRPGLDALRGHGFRHELLSGRFFHGAAGPVIESNAGLRAAQVATFSVAAAHEVGPVVIAGDTNLPGLDPALGSLAPFTDGFAQAGWGLGYTYPNDRRPWMRIDRIMVGGGLRFVGFQVGDSSASDHRCVVGAIASP